MRKNHKKPKPSSQQSQNAPISKASASLVYLPSEEDLKSYLTLKQEIEKRDLSNTENHDKAILTYSALGLTASTTFIKDIVEIKEMVAEQYLFFSWLFFSISIIAVIISFFLSQCALKVQLRNAEDYYLKNDNDAIQRGNLLARATSLTNLTAALFFIVAIGLSTFFCYLNLGNKLLTERNNQMSNNTTEQKALGGAYVPELIQKGANTPAIAPKLNQNIGVTNTNSSDKK